MVAINYIAVRNNQVIDYDTNEIELAKRWEKEPGVLIGSIEGIVNPHEDHLDSPEFEEE